MTTPTNGTTAPVTTGTTQTTQPAPAATTPTEPDYKAKYAEAEQREVQLKRELVVGRQQWQREKQSFGEKLKAADEYARIQKLAKVDKAAAARALLGEKYLEDLNTYAANGNVPTAEAIALENERIREEMRAEFRKELETRDTTLKTAATQAEQNDRASLAGEAAFFYKEVASEFPIFKRLGDEKRIGEILASNFTGPTFARYRSALASADPDTRIALFRKVAGDLENTMLGLVEEATSHEKYLPKLREKLTPPKVAGSVTGSPQSKSLPSQLSQSQSQQGRSSLTNDLSTGSTPQSEEPVETDAQRQRRLVEKYGPTIVKRNS